MYVALHEVTWCMVVWCTQNLHQDDSSFMWHQSCQHCKYTTSVDVKKMRDKKLVTHVESHVSTVSLLESGEQHCIKAINNNHSTVFVACQCSSAKTLRFAQYSMRQTDVHWKYYMWPSPMKWVWSCILIVWDVYNFENCCHYWSVWHLIEDCGKNHNWYCGYLKLLNIMAAILRKWP